MKHPDYPDIDFKPIIASCDWDQTYDVLAFYKLPEGINDLFLLNKIPSESIMAIERFVPNNLEWAFEYSDKVFDLLKKFNACGFYNTLSFQQLTGYYAKHPSLDGNYPYYGGLGYSTAGGLAYDKYKFTFEQGKYYLTFLARDNNQNPSIFNSPHVINRNTYQFAFNKTTEVNLYQLLQGQYISDVGESPSERGWCANSLVLKKESNSNWIDYKGGKAENFWFYSDIDDHFDEVYAQILQVLDANTNLSYESKSETRHYYSVSSNTPYQYSLTPNNYTVIGRYSAPYKHYFKKISRVVQWDDSINVSTKFICTSDYNYEFEELPQWLSDYCFLQRANNDYWKNGHESQSLTDRGISQEKVRKENDSWKMDVLIDTFYEHIFISNSEHAKYYEQILKPVINNCLAHYQYAQTKESLQQFIPNFALFDNEYNSLSFQNIEAEQTICGDYKGSSSKYSAFYTMHDYSNKNPNNYLFDLLGKRMSNYFNDFDYDSPQIMDFSMGALMRGMRGKDLLECAKQKINFIFLGQIRSAQTKVTPPKVESWEETYGEFFGGTWHWNWKDNSSFEVTPIGHNKYHREHGTYERDINDNCKIINGQTTENTKDLSTFSIQLNWEIELEQSWFEDFRLTNPYSNFLSDSEFINRILEQKVIVENKLNN